MRKPTTAKQLRGYAIATIAIFVFAIAFAGVAASDFKISFFLGILVLVTAAMAPRDAVPVFALAAFAFAGGVWISFALSATDIEHVRTLRMYVNAIASVVIMRGLYLSAGRLLDGKPPHADAPPPEKGTSDEG